MRFDNEDRHQEKKLYANPYGLFDLEERVANKLVNTSHLFSIFTMPKIQHASAMVFPFSLGIYVCMCVV